MPLGFNTRSHGEIPIGFFNIETDMILIHDKFMFASDLCAWLSDWAGGPDDQEHTYPMWVFDDGEKIGDLMGAISGTEFTGFIGELYKKWPFPGERSDFKQNPEGWKTREEVERVIEDLAPVKEVAVRISRDEGTISIGEYVFLPEDFHQVILYIWQGGWPRYRDDVKPGYVSEMMKAVLSSGHWLFELQGP
jgi:hypothetical protein